MAPTKTPGMRQGLVDASLLIFALTVLSRLMGLAREIVVAARFGAGGEMDAFNSAFRVPDLLYNSLVTFLVGTALVPVFSSLWEGGDRTGAWRLAASVLTWCFVGLGLVSALLFMAAPHILYVIAPGLDAKNHQLAVGLCRIMVPLVMVGALTGFYKAILTALGQFRATGFIPVAFNACVIASVLVGGAAFGVHSLAYGTALGAAAQAVILLPSSRALGFRWRPHFDLDPTVRRVGMLGLPTVIALALGQLVPLVENMLASRLTVGTIASVGYAYRIFTLPEQVYTTIVSVVLFPTLARLLASNQVGAVREMSRTSLRLTLFAAAPVAVLVCQLSQPVVRVLLRRGAFDESAVGATASILAAYAVGLPAVCMRSLLTYVLFAMSGSVQLLKLTAITVPVNIVVDLALVRYLGPSGIAFGSTLASAIHAGLLLQAFEKRLGSGPRIWPSDWLRIGVACSAMAGVVEAAWRWSPGIGESATLLVQFSGLGGLAVLAASTYVGVTWLLRMEEARMVRSWCLARLRNFSRRTS